jgi:hypothetical protein
VLVLAAALVAAIAGVGGRAVAHARAARVADAAALAAALADPPAARHAAESVAVAHGLALDALAWHDDDGRTVVVCVRAQAARACAAARRTLPS